MDSTQPLLTFIPELSPDLGAPYHLAPLAEALDLAPFKPLRILSSVATRHGKTTTISHAIVKWLINNPKLDIIFMSFGADFSYGKSREIRSLFQQAGGKLSSDHNTIKEWKTAQGGGLFACSSDQDVIGRGAHVFVVDDPIGSPTDADDPVLRDKADARIRFLSSRQHPGASIVVNASRFHPDDPIGRRLNDAHTKWDHIALPAILDEGLPTERALWPEVRSLEHLKQIRLELSEGDPAERTWFAQFMGNPLPDGGNFFGPPSRYDAMPTWPGFRDAIGIDLAYSQTKSADWFALVAGRSYGSQLFIRNVIRCKPDLNELEATIKVQRDISGLCPIYSYVSGPEIGAIQYFATRGVQVQGMPARFNKLVRSQKTRDRWNKSGVLLPNAAPWIPKFLSRISAFRGVEGDQDDEVDALVSLHDGMMPVGSSTGVRTFGKPRY